MKSKRPDRRVARTRETLRQALLSLMAEKGFDALTVQDIIDRANVGRATFYAHFENKEDLLLTGLDELRDTLRRRQREAARIDTAGGRLFAFSREVFLHTAGHPDMLPRMAGPRLAATLEPLFRQMLVDLMRSDVKAVSRRDAVPTEAVVQFLAGAFFALLMWWLQNRKRLSVDEVDSLFHQLAAPAVRSLR